MDEKYIQEKQKQRREESKQWRKESTKTCIEIRRERGNEAIESKVIGANLEKLVADNQHWKIGEFQSDKVKCNKWLPY